MVNFPFIHYFYFILFFLFILFYFILCVCVGFWCEAISTYKATRLKTILLRDKKRDATKEIKVAPTNDWIVRPTPTVFKCWGSKIVVLQHFSPTKEKKASLTFYFPDYMVSEPKAKHWVLNMSPASVRRFHEVLHKRLIQSDLAALTSAPHNLICVVLKF